MLPVPWRERITAGRDRGLTADHVVAAHGRDLPPPFGAGHVAGGSLGLALRAVEARGPLRVVALVRPQPVRAAVHSPVSPLAHASLLGLIRRFIPPLIK